jgi:hypothetical protein
MSAADGRNLDDPIEAYLDQVLVSLPGSARQVRHTLAEVEAHLLDAATAAQANGLDEAAARSLAVQQMGPVIGIADRPSLTLRLTPALRRRVVLSALLIGGVGGIAVGVGGLIGQVVNLLFGDRAIATPFPVGSYTSGDCLRWLAGDPAARDCVAAMTADHARDFLISAAFCGVMGILALAAYRFLRRLWSSPAIATSLPRATEDIVGAFLAFATAVVLVGQGVDAILVTHGNGAGEPFSLAGPALVAAAVFTVRARQRLRRPTLRA